MGRTDKRRREADGERRGRRDGPELSRALCPRLGRSPEGTRGWWATAAFVWLVSGVLAVADAIGADRGDGRLPTPVLWGVVVLLPASGAAVVLGVRRCRQRRRRLQQEFPGQWWLWDHRWDPSGAAEPVGLWLRVGLAAVGGAALAG